MTNLTSPTLTHTQVTRAKLGKFTALPTRHHITVSLDGLVNLRSRTMFYTTVTMVLSVRYSDTRPDQPVQRALRINHQTSLKASDINKNVKNVLFRWVFVRYDLWSKLFSQLDKAS